MFDTIKAVRTLHRVGYSADEARKTAEMILSPAADTLVLDHDFFRNAPDGVGTAIAKILPSSKARKLVIAAERKSRFDVTPLLTAGLRQKMGKPSFSVQYGISEIFKALPQTGITELAVCDTKLGSRAYRDLSSVLPKTGIECLRFDNCDFGDAIHSGGIAEAIGKSRLKILELPNDHLLSGHMSAFVNRLGREATAGPERLNLSGNSLHSAEAGKMWKELFARMPGLKSLDVSRMFFGDPAGLEALARSLPAAKNLTDMDIGRAALDDAGAPRLFDVLPQTNLLRLNLAGNNLRDASAEKLAEVLATPGCRIYETHFTDSIGKVENSLRDHERNPASAAAAAKVAVAEKRNAERHRVRREQEEARRTYAAPEDAAGFADDTLLFTAAKAGKIADVIALKPLSAADYARKDDAGKPLLVHIAEAGTLDAVFKPELWKNPADMQKTWDMVPDKFKKQMDGKEGRPSFARNKNRVMAAAVRTAVSVRNGTNR